MSTPINLDLASNRIGGYSIQPGASRANDGDVNGSFIDLTDADGPIHAECGVGDTGSGGDYSVVFKIEHADDAAGTNVADISGATKTISDDSAGANDETSVIITTPLRDKPFVRVTATVDITAGSSAGTSIPLAATVFGIKKTSGPT